MKHPEWATKYRKRGTELRCINGRYYLYSVSSQWNPQKKRAQKKTGKIIGSITEKGGFKESPKHAIKQKIQPTNISIKEYGASTLLLRIKEKMVVALQKHFPEQWEAIISAAICRLLYQAPLKNMGFYFSHSFLSNTYTSLSMSPKMVSKILKLVGEQRDKILKYSEEFIQPGSHLLVDITNVHSKSHCLNLATKGYNSKYNFDPQINLLMVFSQTSMSPLYYRVLPGNVRDVNAFKLSLRESGIKNAVLIADKGFYSKENVQELDDSGFSYILPLRRNSVLIKDRNPQLLSRKEFEGYFKYNNHYIWYDTVAHDQKKIHLFLDDQLRVREERDYLDRIQTQPEKYTDVGFQEKLPYFGTFSVLTNMGSEIAEKIYNTYKLRSSIEIAFDTLKNVLEADRTYMRDEATLEGWMFINFIALQWYYLIYQVMSKHDLLAKYSPNDLLMHLVNIRKVKIGPDWQLAEITGRTKKLLQKLELDIT